MPKSNCTEVTPACPVDESYAGYDPSKAANVIFTIIFVVSLIAFLIQCIRQKTWSFLIFMGCGTALEAIGYIGRVALANNPWSNAGFKDQIVTLTFAPAFLAGGLYLIFKHVVLTFSADISRIRPQLYTWIFVCCDVVSIVTQAIGAVVAAISVTNLNESGADTGSNIMIAGLAFQVFTLSIFGLLAIEYAMRTVKFSHMLEPATLELRNSRHFKVFFGACIVAYLVMMIRCIYRLVMITGGWGNSLQKNETLYIILDSVMCSIYVLCFNFFHPGFVIKHSKNGGKQRIPSPRSAHGQSHDMENLEAAQDRMYTNRTMN